MIGGGLDESWLKSSISSIREDGTATGATIKLAFRALQRRSSREIVVAHPAALPGSFAMFWNSRAAVYYRARSDRPKEKPVNSVTSG